jgi:DNA-binding transcriptional ArsR family regulator
LWRSRRQAKRADTAGATHANQLQGPALIFAALGDSTRLRLLRRLCDRGPMSISALTTGSHRTRQAITKHLQLMQGAGIVQSQWRGRERFWRLNQARLGQARRYLDVISSQWDDALARLREFVER